MRSRRGSLLVLLAALAAPRPASACGGPDSVDVDLALEPIAVRSGQWLYPWDGWETSALPVTRFLYPLAVDDPPLYAALDRDLGVARDGAPDLAFPDPVAPSTAAFQAALQRGDLRAADTAARATVEAILDLPAPLAEPYGEDLRLAVEFIELRPRLAGADRAGVAAWFASTSAPITLPASLRAAAEVRAAGVPTTAPSPANPRAASLRWRMLLQALHDGVPDGWTAPEIAAAAAAAGDPRFGRLHKQLDTWLHDYPGHPLADLVRLKKVRLDYLAGDADGAWALLVEMYPRHPARVANELRFLTMQGATPRDLPANLPLALRVGLLNTHPLEPEAWGEAWRKAEDARAANQPWGLAVQEKLLVGLLDLDAADGGTDAPRRPLPPGFPATAAAPSATWAKARMLLMAARPAVAATPDFLAQVALVEARDPDLPAALAHVALGQGDWVRAIRTPGLDPAAVQYLVRVLAPEDVVQQLVDDADANIRWEARLGVASRELASTGDWANAARWLDPVDPSRASLWRELGAAASDRTPAGVLAYARELRESGGSVFVGNAYDDVLWYRSLPYSRAPEGWNAHPDFPALAEWPATEAWLKRSFATWYALGAYARWLDMLPAGRPRGAAYTEAMTVLAEADATYNVLLNYGSGAYYAWGSVLPTSAPAKDIRRVGRVLRAK